MKKIFVLIVGLVIGTGAQLHAQSPNRPNDVSNPATPSYGPAPATQTGMGILNYVRSFKARAAITDPALFNVNALPSQMSVTTNYIDGLGRSKQRVYHKDTPLGNDVVQPMEYDAFGRQVRDYMPYVSNSSTPGAYHPDYQFEQWTYYTETNTAIARGEYAYKEKVLEASTLARELVTGGIGQELSLGSGHAKQTLSRYNQDSKEKVWQWIIEDGRPVVKEVEGQNNALDFFPEGELAVAEVIDGNGYMTRSYSDRMGNLLLVKKQNTANATGIDHANWVCTYYVYDDLERLRFVVQPEAVKQLEEINGNSDGEDWDKLKVDAAFFDSYVFAYTYDRRGRVATKKLPGSDWIYMVYNQRDQLVLKQDGNQRIDTLWAYSGFDALNRLVIEGIYAANQVLDQAAMQAAWNAGSIDPESSLFTPQGDLFGGGDGATDGVVKGEVLEINNWDGTSEYKASQRITFQPGFAAIPTQVGQQVKGHIGDVGEGPPSESAPITSGTMMVLAEYYFGSYGFNAGMASDYVYQPQGTEFNSHANMRIHGHPTGAKVQVVGKDEYLYSASFMDERGRTIQTQGDVLGGGLEVVTTSFNFSGNETAKHIDLQGPESINTTLWFGYDDFGRMTTVEQETAGTGRIQVGAYAYNENGQRLNTQLHAYNGADPLQTIDYKYNLQGQLTHINNASANVDADDLFAMELYYYDGFDQVQYNGNVAGMVWRSARRTDSLMAYGFRYDYQSRLTHADYIEDHGGASTWAVNADYYSVSNISYDHNGNITGLTRQGALAPKLSPQSGDIGRIDGLTYGYEGNRLISIEDAEDATIGLAGFKNGNIYQEGMHEYLYDANGNVTKDANKTVSSVTYNYRNLPERVVKDAFNWMEYDYDASGRKLAQRVYENNVLAKTTQYVGSVIFENGVIKEVLHPEGKVKVDLAAGTVRYQYFLKDHLGNTRMVVNAPQELQVMATYESSAAQQEEQQFAHLGETRHTDPLTAHSGRASGRLNAALGKTLGATKTMEVQAGDEITLKAYAMYRNPKAAKRPVSIIPFLQMSNQIGNEGLANKLNLDFGLRIMPSKVLKPEMPSPTAYIGYKLYNAEGELVAQGTQAVTEGASNSWEELELNIPIEQDGHIELYTANESAIDTYFDDVYVVVTDEVVVQETHYYPYGEVIAGLSYDNGSQNAYLYNGNEMQDELGLGWLDYGARMYDPAIARFMTIDPEAESYYSHTPYHYVQGNPVGAVDENGEWVNVLAGFVAGAAADYISQVAVNLVTGKENAFTDVNWSSVLVAGGTGAVTGGLSLIKTTSKIGKGLVKVSQSILAPAAGSATNQFVDNLEAKQTMAEAVNNISAKAVLIDVGSGLAAGRLPTDINMPIPNSALSRAGQNAAELTAKTLSGTAEGLGGSAIKEGINFTGEIVSITNKTVGELGYRAPDKLTPTGYVHLGQKGPSAAPSVGPANGTSTQATQSGNATNQEAQPASGGPVKRQ